MKRLKANGWLAVRSAGSHGLWDISATKPEWPVKFIQVKYTSTPHGLGLDKNTEEFGRYATSAQVPADYELWVYRKGVSEPEVYVPVLTRDGEWEWLRYKRC